MVRMLKQKNANVVVTTNGSYKNAAWWNELTDLLTITDRVVFGIDGTADNFTQYRINADWKSILEGLKICIDSNVIVEWRYILFSFNLNDALNVQNYANDLGVDEFKIIRSNRFDQHTEYLRPDEVGDKFSIQQLIKNDSINIDINPHCKSGIDHYISAEGFYSICCWAADHRFYYRNIFGKNRKNVFNISETTLSEMLNNPLLVEFYNNTQINKPDFCQFNCPKI